MAIAKYLTKIYWALLYDSGCTTAQSLAGGSILYIKTEYSFQLQTILGHMVQALDSALELAISF